MAEFEKWSPSLRKIVYKGNPNTRAETLRIMKTTKWNVCITTYDFILKDRLKLGKYDWKYIVIDEGHKMKNAKSKFSNILGQQYQSDHRLLLTGTPLQNNLGELWALLNFLLPKVFNSCDDFEKWFSMAIYRNTGDESVQLDEE
jgi:ATP-dependent helicase STH1/SNF2